MAKHGKRLKKAYENFNRDVTYNISEAVKIVKDAATSKFDETVEIAMNLGVDPKHADQMVRGVVSLPHGTGKALRVAVFAKGDKAKEAEDAGADIVTVHPESGPHLHRSIQLIKSLDCRAGVALNPGTPAEAVDHVLDAVDLVLVMSVNPGFGGQAFIHLMLDKIRALRAKIDATGRRIDLQVDGGVNGETAALAVAAGADVLVAGTAVFSGGPSAYAENIARLKGA